MPRRRTKPELPLTQVDFKGIHFETGVPVTFEFVRNTVPSHQFGTEFQQHIEPAGRFMLVREVSGPPPSGWESGTVTFEHPLVIAFNTQGGGYDEHSWKAKLSAAYRGKKGRALSRALLADGYDGIVTVGGYQGEHEPMEIIDLTVLRNAAKSDMPNWFDPRWMKEVMLPPDKILFHGTSTVVPKSVARQWVGPSGFYVTPMLDVAEDYAKAAEVRFVGKGPGRVLSFRADELGLQKVLVVTREPSAELVRHACDAGYDGVWGPKLWGIFVCGRHPSEFLVDANPTMRRARRLANP